MELHKRIREYWGILPFAHVRPFGTELSEKGGAFIWPAFEAVIDQIVTAVRRRKFLIVTGLACSAKSTAWSEALARLSDEDIRLCRPYGSDPAKHNESTIYHALYYGIQPAQSQEHRLRRGREDRARQCRHLLENANAARTAVVLAVNDAHKCRSDFLLCAKRLWDDLWGFDRLLAVVLIGQEDIETIAQDKPEIDQRKDIVRMPGLGTALGDYLLWEWQRISGPEAQKFPFDDSAIEELSKLHHKNWKVSRDHPLIVNNLVCKALVKGQQTKEKSITGELIRTVMCGEDEREGRR